MILLAGRRVLLLQLADRFVGQWILPSGGAEAGEKIVDTALRELNEETGIGPEQVHVLGVASEGFKYDFPEAQREYWADRGSSYRGQHKMYVVGQLTREMPLQLEYGVVSAACWADIDDLSGVLFQPEEAPAIVRAVGEFLEPCLEL